MRIAVAGKGGVGKTTICAALARALAAGGRRVLAVDADPNNCLGAALGASPQVLDGITPISEMKELLAERAGTAQGGSFFSLEPPVEDLIERYSVAVDGISLLVMGTVEQAGAGCVCPESAVLKALTRRLVDRPDQDLLMDMEAGLEHLGRGTSRHVDLLLIVAEPTEASLATARRIALLGRALGIPRIALIGNKVSNPAAGHFIRERADPWPVIGYLPFDRRLGLVDFFAAQPASHPFSREIDELLPRIERLLAGDPA